jgi:uncharacterized membrane protein YheB (UPF0754 family)
MFDSYQKNKFVVGKEYYTYFFETTQKQDSIRYYTGIMKVKVTFNGKREGWYIPHTEFEILESDKPLDNMEDRIHTYMDGYGSAFTYFFEDKEECVNHHDKILAEIAKNLSTSKKEKILKKLINNNSYPQKRKIEIESVDWYNSLTKKQKLYVEWLKYYYDDL